MKRFVTLLLMMALMFNLVACSGTVNGEIKEPESVVAGQVNAATEATNEADQAETGEVVQETAVSADSKEVMIEEVVLVDEADIKITAKGLEESYMGTEIKLLIENNSNQNLTVQARNTSVNGYMVSTMMSADVAAGKKANDSLTIMSSSLEMCGIEAIADMEFSFHIFKSDDWSGYLDTPQIQLKTSIADGYEYTYDESGFPIYEGNGIKIIAKGLSEDASYMGPSLIVYISNTSGRNITVQTRDTSINGFMVNPIFSEDVMDGKCAIGTIDFMNSDLTENEIKAIENIELTFHIFDEESWDTIVDTEAVTLLFE